MPLPIPPSVFIVLTNASTGAVNRLPRMSSIMANASVVFIGRARPRGMKRVGVCEGPFDGRNMQCGVGNVGDRACSSALRYVGVVAQFKQHVRNVIRPKLKGTR